LKRFSSPVVFLDGLFPAHPSVEQSSPEPPTQERNFGEQRLLRQSPIERVFQGAQQAVPTRRRTMQSLHENIERITEDMKVAMLDARKAAHHLDGVLARLDGTLKPRQSGSRPAPAPAPAQRAAAPTARWSSANLSLPVHAAIA
jgi:hypothetical protein